MNLPTQAQISAGIRYASGYLATGGTVIVAIGLLPPDTAHGIVDASQKVLTDLKQLVGDSYLLAGLVLPVVAGLLARLGIRAASPKSQVASVQALPTVQVLTTDPKLATAPDVKLVEKLPS